MRRLVVCFTALCLLTAPAFSAEEPSKLDCENAMNTHDMNTCAEAELDKADAVLNKTYKEALAAIPEMASTEPYDAKGWENALRASQRAWVAFRDAECNAHVPMFWSGGTGATAEIFGCMSAMTKARTETLKEQYETK